MKRHLTTSLILLTRSLLIAICCLLSAAAAAQGPEGYSQLAAMFEQANIAHTRGEHQQAINLYLTIIRSSGISAPLLCNLANSYAADGQTGQAVLNYERALRLAPGDTDIAANLAQVLKDAGLYRDDLPLYERLAELLGADQWLMLSGATFLLLVVVGLAASFAGKERFSLIRLLLISSLLVIAVTLPLALFRYQSWNDGTVMDEDARLLISPFAEAASSGSIKAGSLVRPGKVHGAYVLVQDESGRSGWLAQNSFQLITDLPISPIEERPRHI